MRRLFNGHFLCRFWSLQVIWGNFGRNFHLKKLCVHFMFELFFAKDFRFFRVFLCFVCLGGCKYEVNGEFGARFSITGSLDHGQLFDENFRSKYFRICDIFYTGCGPVVCLLDQVRSGFRKC